MWRLIALPFRLLGGLAVLGVAYLLFVLGFILLVAFLSASSPYHPVDAEVVVVEVREYCLAETYDGRTRSTKASGFCNQYEKQLKSNPTSYDGHPWTREPYAQVKYRDEDGLEKRRAARASELQIPLDVKVGDRVRFKALTKKRTWQQWRSDWAESLPILGLMIGSLLASAVLWTWGGGWRLMDRQRRRENRATMAKFQLLSLLVGCIVAALAWVWRRIEHTRFGKAAYGVCRDQGRTLSDLIRLTR